MTRRTQTASWRPRDERFHPHEFRSARVAVRIVAVCLAFAIPAGALASVAWTTRLDQVAVANAERQGLALLVPVRQVLEAELELHAASTTAVATPAQEERVRRLIDYVDARTRELSDLAGRAIALDGAAVTPAVDAVRTAWRDVTPGDSLADTTAVAVTKTLDLLAAIVNESHLAQDPGFASYYLISASLLSTPELLQSAATLGTSGQRALRQDDFSAEVRTRLTSVTALLEDQGRRLVSEIGHATGAKGDPHLAANLEEPLVLTIAAVAKLVDHGERLGRDAPVKPTPAELRSEVANATASLFVLWEDAAAALDDLLAARVHDLRRTQMLAAAMVGIALVVVTLLVLSTFRDLRRRREIEQALVHQAAHDGLTRLPNRTLFRERLDQALSRARRCDGALAVLFIDLDDFKQINDRLGHAAGDEFLCAVAERIRKTVRISDTAARLGGDEFAILLEDVEDAAAVSRVAHALLESLRDPVDVSTAQLPIHVSIGIAMASGHTDPDVLVRNADAAMYSAKSQGKGSVKVFDGDNGVVGDGEGEEIEFMAGLHGAAQRGELRLHYQPKVDLAAGNVVGLEALVRWEHPERGLVPPMKFIPYAERSGLIIEIGRWVLRHACMQAAQWHELFPGRQLFVSVNVSTRQLRHPGVVDDVRETLAASGLPADLLILELTETAIADGPQVVARLEELKTLGIRLAIDDFGTGYSSLAYLTRLPIDIVKIDKSFVDKLGDLNDAAGDALTRKIVELSHALGFETVAEGIETAAQAARLLEFGCGLGQGYHYSRPAAASVIDSFLIDHPMPGAPPVSVSASP